MITATIGMPTFDDIKGVRMTLQHLNFFHDCRRNPNIELLVVNNRKNDPRRAELEGTCQNMGARYVHYDSKEGPAGAKNVVFDSAKGEVVFCIDSHVMFPRIGSIQRMLQYFEDNPENMDLFTGPILMDDGNVMATHFDPVWSGGMWGVWAKDEDHEDPESEMFEVWGNGCGMMICRKEAWVGFNSNFLGFGAEEGYIHEKFRKYGRKVWCAPDMQWWHDFSKNNASQRPSYAATVWNKVRNFVLGHQELGMDVAPIKEHFVDCAADAIQGRLPLIEWEALLEDPLRPKPPRSSVSKAIVASGHNVMQVFETVRGIERDLNEHMNTMREIATRVGSIVEVSERRESAIAFAAAKPKSLISYNTEINDELLSYIQEEEKFELYRLERQDFPVLPEADMYFIDLEHTKEYLDKLLSKRIPNRYILLHDTQLYANEGEQKKPGLVPWIRGFLKEHRDWFIARHWLHQHGLTLLSCNEQDRPIERIFLWKLGFGPGSELKKLNNKMGIKEKPDCSCNAIMNQMDWWGADQCEVHKDWIVKQVRANSEHYKWTEKISAGIASIFTGVAFQLEDKTDPYPSLVSLAIQNFRKIEHMFKEEDYL